MSLVSVLLVLYGTRQGSLVGPDSATYIAGARNLAAGRGYVGFDLRPTTLFPPGFSATLALARTTGIDPVTAARWLNALSLGALCMLTFVLARRHSRFRWSPVIAAAAVVSLPAIFRVFTAVWSEPVFCVLTVGVLLTLESVLTSHARNPVLVATAGLLASAGVFYRYAGVTLIVFGLIVVGAAALGDGARAAVRRVTLFFVAAASGPVLMLIWNSSRGSALGPRPSSAETIPSLLGDFMTTLRGWVVGYRHGHEAVADIAVIAALALVGFGAATLIRTHTHEPRSLRPLLPSGLFVAIYVGYLIASEFLTALDPVGDRLLSPIIAPVIVLATLSLESFVSTPRAVPQPLRIGAIVVVASVWLATSILISVSRAHGSAPAQDGFAATWWTRSDLVGAVRQLPPGATLFSNNPSAIYLATSIQPIYNTPTLAISRSNDAPPGLASFRSRVASSPGPAYLAWVLIVGDTWDVTPQQLQAAGFRLTPVKQAHFGTIYRIEP